MKVGLIFFLIFRFSAFPLLTLSYFLFDYGFVQTPTPLT